MELTLKAFLNVAASPNLWYAEFSLDISYVDRL